jgi:hypothetical protein
MAKIKTPVTIFLTTEKSAAGLKKLCRHFKMLLSPPKEEEERNRPTSNGTMFRSSIYRLSVGAQPSAPAN